MTNLDNVKNKSVLIVGFGRSGQAAAKELARVGAFVTVQDSAEEDQSLEDGPSEGDQTVEDDPSGGDQAVEEYPDEEVTDSPAMQNGEAETYTLELDNDEGIEESSGPESAKAGDQVTVSVTIKDGFYFYEAIYDVDAGPVHAVEVNENTYSLTFEMPAQNVLL